MFAFKFACELILFGFIPNCFSQLMSAVASRTEACNTRLKGIMGGGGSAKFAVLYV